MPFYHTPKLTNLKKTDYKPVDADRFEASLILSLNDALPMPEMGVLKPQIVSNPNYAANSVAHTPGHLSTVESKHWTKLRDTVNDLRDLYAEGRASTNFGTNFWLLELGRYIGFKCKAVVVPGPMKQFSGAMAKLGLPQVGMERDEHYAGDVSKLKDVFRLTLVSEDEEMTKNIRKKIIDMCVSQNNMSYIKNEARPWTTDDYGYSDVNMVVCLPNKRYGEIQINEQGVLYGKMSPKSFVEKIMGKDVPINPELWPDYIKLKDAYKVPGGWGHWLYATGERGNKTPEVIKECRRISKIYYSIIRGLPQASGFDLDKFIKEYLDFHRSIEVVGAISH